MGRPSKLTQWQADEVARRLLGGERPADLAREFKVSKSVISERFSERLRTVRAVANQLLQANEALRALSPAEQLDALRFADDMRVTAVANRLVAQAWLGGFLAG